ncbi:hypothetical protein C2S53_005686 [Perilla frutescens var. hirtella]|uniref:RRM domain-containing protein n=1 Tax=Perilla frutescens var. hirtella TaxID=608512 RepID=A0AAD4J4T8_PERFH|nr:hypothetical protein C2S53_005686 [Perilla frutescens var. hirtella]
MNEPGFPRLPVHHLDPAAQEFFPVVNLSSVPPHMYYSYPPPPMYDNMVYTRPQFPPPPPFVSAAAEPPPPLPLSVPPASAAASRTLLLSMVPTSVSESTVRRELEVFGDVRSVQMERRREGLVTVHFYDVRDAQAALMAIQEQHMQQQFRLGRHYEAVLNNAAAPLLAVAPPLPPQTARGLISGRVVWAQFITPVTSGLPDGNNQGTLVIFNLATGVSASSLKDIFQQFGPVKELRETPNKRYQRFVEFYDVRDSARAIAALNGRDIFGKNVLIEFSRPGGLCKKFWKAPLNNGANCPTPTIATTYSSRNVNNSSSSSRCNLPSPPYAARPPRWKGYPSGSDGSKSSSSGSVTNLCITGYEECSSNITTTTTTTNNSNNSRLKKSIISKKGNNTSSKQPSHGGGRQWKGSGGCGGGSRRGKDHDPRFLINEDTIVESNSRDSRTTVMIKNIPNKYSQKLLLNMLDNHCIHCNEQITGGDDQPLSSYDFVYLPIDFINKCNVGYGFVNMTSPEATLRLYKAFHHQNWEVFNSRKICEGLDALREHFKNSKFPGDAEEYMPVVFSPSRDGRTLTDPVPIIGRAGDSPPPPPLSPPSSAASSKENQSEPPSDEGGRSGGCCSYDEADV